jgi:hypothetical protein
MSGRGDAEAHHRMPRRVRGRETGDAVHRAVVQRRGAPPHGMDRGGTNAEANGHPGFDELDGVRGGALLVPIAWAVAHWRRRDL